VSFLWIALFSLAHTPSTCFSEPNHRRYFIPEDGDVESQPNVFLAPKPRHAGSPPSLGQVKDSFPLPGQYHFRFKAPLSPGGDRDKGAMAVWMDVVDERQPVPTWKNGIICKVTRISMEDDDDDDDDEDDHHRHQHHGSAAATDSRQQHQQQPPSQQQQPAPSRGPPSHASSTVSAGSHGSIDDLFGSPPAPAPAAMGGVGHGGSLLDFNDHSSAQQQGGGAVHTDFFGMTAPSHSAAPVSGGGGGGYPGSAPTSGGYPGNPNVFQQQQQPYSGGGYSQQPPQQQQQQNQGGAFGGLGTPWK
jgi:hypothetical protein